MKEKFFGVNVPHTFQLHDDTFFIGMEVQSQTKKKPEEFVMMLSTGQVESIIFYYNQLKEGLTQNEK